MSDRFRFPLARLLSIRERKERDAAISLAAARAKETALLETHAANAAHRDAARAGMMPVIGATRGLAELQNAAFLIEQLDVRGAAVAKQLDVAARTSFDLQATLVERVRERRVLERLRDRQQADWRVEADRRDREQMDALAQSRAQTAVISPRESQEC